MDDHIRFSCAQDFVGTEEVPGVLSVEGADWFQKILQRIAGLDVDAELCQEDWGVVFFAAREGKRFWIGLGGWPDPGGEWMVHLHHHSFAWKQRFSRAGKRALQALIADVEEALRADPSVSEVMSGTDSEVA